MQRSGRLLGETRKVRKVCHCFLRVVRLDVDSEEQEYVGSTACLLAEKVFTGQGKPCSPMASSAAMKERKGLLIRLLGRLRGSAYETRIEPPVPRPLRRPRNNDQARSRYQIWRRQAQRESSH